MRNWLVKSFAIAFGLLLLGAGPALAVPSYAEQTGQPCSACHVGGFGPQLTPFGRTFKLEGYTMRSGDDFTTPVSAMAVFSYVHTNADQPPPAPHYAANDNTTLDQASLFLAGGIGDHFGGFTQWTYDGVGRAFSWDNLDIRAVTHETIVDSDVLLGVSLNNNPTIGDPWNTLPGWGFPYTDSDLMPGPDAGTIIDGGLAQSVLGLNAYAWWDSSIYTEAGVYWTPGHDFLRAMGPDSADVDVIDGAAPYFRAAYQKDYGDQNFEVGAFAMFPDLYPGGDKSAGTSDRYSDIGLDASYQFVGDSSDIYQVNARYTYESQDLRASYILDAADHPHNHLSDFRMDGSYYWHNMVGGSVGFFDTTGSSDSELYAGDRTLTPDSDGFLFQLDFTPWGDGSSPLGARFNMRAGLQYVVFTRFNGASGNYDGLGHNASDNDTLRIFTWFAL